MSSNRSCRPLEPAVEGVSFDVAKGEISARIRRVCENFREDEFAALVERMAEIEVRYRLRDDWLFARDVATSEAQQPAVH